MGCGTADAIINVTLTPVATNAIPKTINIAMLI
jgi:hypothetical protein